MLEFLPTVPRHLAVVAMVGFVGCHAHAQPSIAAEYGHEKRGGIERAAAGFSVPTPWEGQLGSAAWAATLNVDIARWHATSRAYGHADVSDLGVTPQLRFVPTYHVPYQPYLDVGLGVHGLTADDCGKHRLGTTFQFGEYLGAGVAFGERRQYTVALRILHESNGGLSRYNGGLSTVGLRLEYRLP